MDGWDKSASFAGNAGPASLNFIVMRASVIAFTAFLVACASHRSDDILSTCLGSLTAQDGLRDSTKWVSVAGAAPMVL
jgi:hypothetical protein